MKLKTSILFIIYILFLLIPTRCNSQTTNEPTEFEKAFQEVAYAYYMRGTNIQYNSRKGIPVYYAPEETTSQNMNYLVCSSYAKNIYYDLFEIKIPPYTSSLLNYGKDYIGNPEVIAYGSKDGNNLIMKFYDQDAENNYVSVTNPTTDELLQYLKCGDVITYTGHTMIVYKLKYNSKGNVTDAYIIESGHGYNSYHAMTKMPKSISIGNNISFGSTNTHHLYHNRRNYNGTIEGSLHVSTLKTVGVWKDLSNPSKDEYSVLRFIDDSTEDMIINYHGTDFNDSDYNGEVINFTEKTLDRLKFSKLYIEKTVNEHNDDIVEPSTNLTYQIIIKNNSNTDYEDDLVVSENISEYVEYKSYEVNKENIIFNQDLDNNKIEWNIGKLSSGDTVTINYTVVVKENSKGNVIISTGMVNKIPSSVIRNTVGSKLKEYQKEKIQEKYNALKDIYSGKKLINEIYSEALGVDLGFDQFDITDLVTNKNFTSISASTGALNNKNSFFDFVLNKYWNTLYIKKYVYNDTDVYEYDMKNWRTYDDEKRRADTIYSENFETGDILVYKNNNDVTYNYSDNTLTITPITYENGTYAYIYIEGEGFVGVNLGDDEIKGNQDDRNEYNVSYYTNNGLNVYSNTNETDEEILSFMNYQTLFGKDYYVILRPSLAINLNLSLLTDEAKDILTTLTINSQKIDVLSETSDSNIIKETFIENNFDFPDGCRAEVFDKDGNEITENKKLGSRSVITIYDENDNEIASFTVIVKGDVTGNGEVKIYDAFKILVGAVTNSEELDELELLIRDYNNDGQVKIFDAFNFLIKTIS